MDRNALRTVQEEPGMPEELKSLPDEAVALLIDTSSDTPEALTLQFQEYATAFSPPPQAAAREAP